MAWVSRAVALGLAGLVVWGVAFTGAATPDSEWGYYSSDDGNYWASLDACLAMAGLPTSCAKMTAEESEKQILPPTPPEASRYKAGDGWYGTKETCFVKSRQPMTCEEATAEEADKFIAILNARESHEFEKRKRAEEAAEAPYIEETTRSIKQYLKRCNAEKLRIDPRWYQRWCPDERAEISSMFMGDALFEEVSRTEFTPSTDQ